MSSPIICFGQQPTGFFPKRYLVAKIQTARRLQSEIGGKIVFFYHDSDHDYRETVTTLTDRTNGNRVKLNFTMPNKVQKLYSPLYFKQIAPEWQADVSRKLPTFVDSAQVAIFQSIQTKTVGQFCLDMYIALGWLEGIEVMRSGDPVFRAKAPDLADGFFADVPYEGEVVRARDAGPAEAGQRRLQLHKGGPHYLDLPVQPVVHAQKNPARDQRMDWMQQVIGCTHYIAGASEWDYLDRAPYPGIHFIHRDEIEAPEMAWTETR